MSEPVSNLEKVIASALREYVDAQHLDMPASDVVARSVNGRREPARIAARRPWLIGVGAVAAAIVVLIGAYGLIGRGAPGGDASDPARVTVEGRQYYVAGGRSLAFNEDDLVPYAEATGKGAAVWLLDGTVYRLPGIAPSEALVARPNPDLIEDDGPMEDFLILLGDWGKYPAGLCRFVKPGHPNTPTECL